NGFTQNLHTRISYMTRPIADWPTGGDPTPSLDLTQYIQAVGLAGRPKGWPKWSKLKNKSVVCDLIRFKPDVIRTHKFGINVLYGNGSGQWVPLKAFDASLGGTTTQISPNFWHLIGDQDVSSAHNVKMLDETFVRNTTPPHIRPTGVWADLDAASR